MARHLWRICLHSSIALLLGSGIYLVSRPDSIGVAWLIHRRYVALPEWLAYNLPDGLWLYSLICLYRALWPALQKREVAIWSIATVCLAIASEFLQRWKIISGTFDWWDIATYLLAGCCALIPIFFTTQNHP